MINGSSEDGLRRVRAERYVWWFEELTYGIVNHE